MVIAAVGTVTYEMSDTAADSVQGIVPVPHRLPDCTDGGRRGRVGKENSSSKI